MSIPPPLIISTFEIKYLVETFKADLSGPPTDAIFLLKEYFLTLSNPNPAAYVFNLGFHCSPTPGNNRLHSLASAVAFLVDINDFKPLKLQASGTSHDFYTSVLIPAESSVRVGLRPDFFEGSERIRTSNIKVRGWVDITLPAQFGGNNGTLIAQVVNSKAQSNGPVPLLLTPEQRVFYNSGEPLNFSGYFFYPYSLESVSTFTLPLGGGAALVNVPPQPGGLAGIVAALSG